MRKIWLLVISMYGWPSENVVYLRREEMMSISAERDDVVDERVVLGGQESRSRREHPPHKIASQHVTHFAHCACSLSHEYDSQNVYLTEIYANLFEGFIPGLMSFV